MDLNETIIAEIVDGLGQSINESEQAIKEAMQAMEKMGTSSEEYKEADKQLVIHSYASRYLSHIKDSIADSGEAKTAEKILRFHSFSQRNKGAIDGSDEFSAARTKIVNILEGYIEKHFNA